MENLDKKLICIVCPVGCRLKVAGKVTDSPDDLKVEGQQCKRGIAYAHDEITNPVRMVCTTAKIKGGIYSIIPVRTDKPIPDKYKLDVVKAVNEIALTSPVKMGDVIISDLFGTGVNIIAERNM
jgi:CxxC motif-containing protein